MVSPPEWDVVRREVQAALVAHTSVRMQLARCARIEVYTDGSAPQQNPGGSTGFAAIVLGFAPCQATEPAVRLDVGGYLPGRTADPPTTNNRAEIAKLAEAAGLMRLDMGRADPAAPAAGIS
jgi:hypothetical protein